MSGSNALRSSLRGSRKTATAERFKTKPCKSWEESGSCPYEHKCMFAHGDEDLRTTEQNVEDGLVSPDAVRSYQIKLKHSIKRAARAARRAQERLQERPERSRSSSISSGGRSHNHYCPYLTGLDSSAGMPHCPYYEALSHEWTIEGYTGDLNQHQKGDYIFVAEECI